MKGRRKSPEALDGRILAALRRRGRGCVVVPSDFLDLGSRTAIDVALHRLVRAGSIRRLARGVYDFPKEHPQLGPLSPPPDAVARAIAGRDRVRLQPAGAYAANTLGLTQQVPAKVVFLTDGPSRTVIVGGTTIQLYRLRWDGAAIGVEALQATADSPPFGSWEHVTFARAGIKEVPVLPPPSWRY
jgi:hypothetical protein